MTFAPLAAWRCTELRNVYSRIGNRDVGLEQGTRLWFYESNAQGPPYPTFASMMTGSRLSSVLAAWTVDDPWGPTIGFGKTGDGVLLYPGNHDRAKAPLGSPADVAIDGPIPSRRLQMVRQGLQDWALFQLAEQKGKGAQARASVAKVYSQMGGCTYAGCPAPAGGFHWKSDEALVGQVRAEVTALALQSRRLNRATADRRDGQRRSGRFGWCWQPREPDGRPIGDRQSGTNVPSWTGPRLECVARHSWSRVG
jgi:hypothetical protein